MSSAFPRLRLFSLLALRLRSHELHVASSLEASVASDVAKLARQGAQSRKSLLRHFDLASTGLI